MDRATAESVLRPEARVALDAWRVLVEADNEQVRRISERDLDADYYAPMTERFRPGSRPSQELPVLEVLARAEDTWIDIGAGGGRLAIPLAGLVRRVIAVEPSEAMRSTLEAARRDAGLANLEIVSGAWPDAAASGDVALSANAVYDIADIGAWIDGMERAASRLCVMVLFDRGRGHAWSELFEAVHGEPIAALPAAREFVAVLGALGRTCAVQTIAAEPPGVTPEEAAYTQARRICWLLAGSERDARMQAFLRAHYLVEGGGYAMPAMRRALHVITWTPPGNA
ncbi:MAG: methyltransferase domain-containing protein [Dehalococcoidia bacterium]|nr:methyltransferase domain-containing protein [Dehalococcoidia bacterium]